MDWSDFGAAAGIFSMAVHAAQALLQIVNHKRIRSTCCGKEMDTSLDIEETTPPAKLPV